MAIQKGNIEIIKLLLANPNIDVNYVHVYLNILITFKYMPF